MLTVYNYDPDRAADGAIKRIYLETNGELVELPAIVFERMTRWASLNGLLPKGVQRRTREADARDI